MPMGFVSQYGNYARTNSSGRVGHAKRVGPTKGMEGLGDTTDYTNYPWDALGAPLAQSTVDLSGAFDWISGKSGMNVGQNGSQDSTMTVSFPWLTASAQGIVAGSGTSNLAPTGIMAWINDNKTLVLAGVALGLVLMTGKR